VHDVIYCTVSLYKSDQAAMVELVSYFNWLINLATSIETLCAGLLKICTRTNPGDSLRIPAVRPVQGLFTSAWIAEATALGERHY